MSKKSQKHTRLNKASLLCVHSRSVVTATEMLWLSCVLAALLSTANSNSHKGRKPESLLHVNICTEITRL